ncbi:MAG: hypothetical protein NVS3B26_17260 [Mycobacteriales bacterium]
MRTEQSPQSGPPAGAAQSGSDPTICDPPSSAAVKAFVGLVRTYQAGGEASPEKSGRACTPIDVCKRLLRDSPSPVFLILDGHPVHRSKAITAYAASTNGQLRLGANPTWTVLPPLAVRSRDTHVRPH